VIIFIYATDPLCMRQTGNNKFH